MQNPNQNKVIYDWFSMTSKIHDVNGMIEEIGMQRAPWLTLSGVRGYSWRQHCNSINVHYGKRPEVWLEMSGSGCRAFEDLGHGDYEHLFELCRESPEDIHLTRLDIAFDDFDHILDMQQLKFDADVGDAIVCKADDICVTTSRKVSDPNMSGTTISVGSEKSEIYIRIYDKRAERLNSLQTKKERDEFCANVPHWVRVEIQLRRERAYQWLKEIGERKLSIGEMFAGVLRNYLRFVERPIGSSDENRWRWPMKPYWAELIAEAEAIKLYEKPGMEYNLQRLDRLTTYQVGNAVDTAIKIHGVDGFMKLLESNKPPKKNPKYDMLLKQYGTADDTKTYNAGIYDGTRDSERINPKPGSGWEWDDGDDILHVDPERAKRIAKANADMEALHREAQVKNEQRSRAIKKAKEREAARNTPRWVRDLNVKKDE